MKVKVLKSNTYRSRDFFNDWYYNEGEILVAIDKKMQHGLTEYTVLNPSGEEFIMYADEVQEIQEPKLFNVDPDFELNDIVHVRESGKYTHVDLISTEYVDSDDELTIIRIGGNNEYYIVRNSNGTELIFLKKYLVLKKDDERRYMYAFVRTDLELADQLVQVAHATYESGRSLANNAVRTTLIVLGVKDKYHLEDAIRHLKKNDIFYAEYTEQTKGLGKTAIATEALTSGQRSIMKKFQLLKVK